VTNVPGPQFPLYLLGKELREFIPVAFLAQDQALAVAIISYNGNVVIGLMGDYDAMPDLDAFAADIEASTEELRQAAGLVPGRKPASGRRSKARAAGNGAQARAGTKARPGGKRRSASERAKARSAASRSKGAISSVTRTPSQGAGGDGAEAGGERDGD